MKTNSVTSTHALRSPRWLSPALFLVALLAGFTFSHEAAAQSCQTGEAVWQYASTNRMRCGTKGLQGTNTYYFDSTEEIWDNVWAATNHYGSEYTYTKTVYTGGVSNLCGVNGVCAQTSSNYSTFQYTSGSSSVVSFKSVTVTV